MLSTDRITFFLGVGALVVTLGVGTCSTNARIDDLNGRLDAFRADVNRRLDERFDGVHQRFDDHVAGVNRRFDEVDRRFDDHVAGVNRRFDEVDRRFDDVGAGIRGLRADVVGIDERLRVVEVALGRVDQRLLTIERVVLPAESPGE